MENAARQSVLFRVDAGVRACVRCKLAATRTCAVPGEGAPDARVVLVGEAPGQVEDETGRPFVGRTGVFLDRALAEAGIERSRLWITPAVKCRPPGNRDPHVDERVACAPWLVEELDALGPELVLVMGRVALTQCLAGAKGVDVKAPLTSFAGRNIKHEGRTYRVTCHPTAAMRFPKMRARFAEDLLAVAAVLQT